MITIRADAVDYLVELPHAGTDFIQSRLAETGRPYEEAMLEDMAARLTPGDLVVDVGANIGNHTLYLAAVAGARVIAFEPNPDLTAPLLRSVAANGFGDRVTIRPVGVASSSGRGVLTHLNPGNLGAQAVELADGAGDFDVVALDDEVFDRQVAALKVDVEGGELEVLRGARDLIARDRPTIYVECADADGFRAVADLLGALAYALVGTFNWTPTHVFAPSASRAELEAALRQVTLERYKVDAARADLRRHLSEVAVDRLE